MSDLLLQEFDSRKHILEAMLISVQRLISDLLANAEISVHTISGRIKTRESLSEKLSRKGKSYQKLTDITDLVGLRIVTFFEDDVDRVAELIRSEFDLVQEHCVDKRNSMEPDRFGYLSLHYVCGLTTERKHLRENNNFKVELFELQIRSILQHAWAEIEHDLGYKREFAVPNEIKRQLFRVAGLLEIADRDFREIRDRSKAYGERVAAEISRNEIEQIGLDSVSYEAFVNSSQLVRELDEYAESFSGQPSDPDLDPEMTVGCLRFTGIDTVEKLQTALLSNKDVLKKYVAALFTDGSHVVPFPFAKAISLFHLPQILAVRIGGHKKLAELFTAFNIGLRCEESALESAEIIEKIDSNLPEN